MKKVDAFNVNCVDAFNVKIDNSEDRIWFLENAVKYYMYRKKFHKHLSKHKFDVMRLED